MKWKKCLLAVLIICMFLCVGAVSAGENVTSELSDSGYCDNITQVQESDYADEPLAQAQDDDVLSTSKTVYFDASATKDGDGSSSNPYKNFQASRLKSVSTAYFAKGTYTISSTTEIDNFLTYTTTIIGEGSENTIFKASTSSYSFKIKEKSTLILKGITFTNVKFSNYGTLDISDSVFCDYKKAYRVVHQITVCFS